MKLGFIMLVSALAQAAISGARLDLSLSALALGGSAATVGLLNTLYAVLPALLAVHTGRHVDRTGTRAPTALGLALVIAGMLLAATWRSIPGQHAAAVLVGTGQMIVNVGISNATGAIARPEQRASFYSWGSLAMLAGGSLGILASGFGIEHIGHARAFALMSLFGAAALLAVWLWGSLLPRLEGSAGAASTPRHAAELLRVPGLPTLFCVSAMVSLSWDLYQIIVPIHGHEIGLPASTIGTIMASFPVGNFAIRALVPVLSRHFREWTLITATLAAIGSAFLLLPLAHAAPALMAIAFLLGCGFGFSYPSAMALIFSLTPAGRQGEAIGIRTTMQNLSHVVAPMSMGALFTVVGVTPVVWLIAASMVLTGAFAHRAGRRARR